MENTPNVPFRFKRGLYESEYGNTVYVSGPNAKTAYDLDAGERIPMEMVTSIFKRSVGKGETFGTGHD